MAYNTSALVLNDVSMKEASYVTGLVDGEGSFLISFQQRTKMKTGIEVRPSFTLSQHQRNLELLQWLQAFFGCGSLRYNRSDETYKYEVRSIDDLTRVVIPHFEAYPLKSSKHKDFLVFKKVCEAIQRRAHLTRDGLERIITQAYGMNNFGARRYDKQSLLQILTR